jgi:hypothetical protein
MTENRTPAPKQISNSSANQSCDEPRSSSIEEAKVWAALEQARQNVKPIVKKEREAEIVSAELLNLRLKAI